MIPVQNWPKILSQEYPESAQARSQLGGAAQRSSSAEQLGGTAQRSSSAGQLCGAAQRVSSSEQPSGAARRKGRPRVSEKEGPREPERIRVRPKVCEGVRVYPSSLKRTVGMHRILSKKSENATRNGAKTAFPRARVFKNSKSALRGYWKKILVLNETNSFQKKTARKRDDFLLCLQRREVNIQPISSPSMAKKLEQLPKQGMNKCKRIVKS